MTSSSSRAEEIFYRALDLSGKQRADYLASACADDPDLRRDVDELLLADESKHTFLASPFKPNASDNPDDAGSDSDPLIGKSIGQYLIKRRVAVGGMGVVYEAHQSKPSRTVALKILPRQRVTPAMLRRFSGESDILARLDHPNVARVYEAGTHHLDGDPIPYFAMEYLADAKPVTEFARLAGLSSRERLQLFIKICDAVQHGHQRGIIHRDLKPSNILVVPSGEPKVIDFGVARVTDADVSAVTRQTASHEVIGTLRYMSPEQCSGTTANIDTRTDVYALGVVLFELLTGKMPYDVDSVTPYEIPRVIRDTHPTRVSSTHPALRGDVETILQKALEKDPERRYATAAAMGEDIRRYLNDEPIIARPPSRSHQLRLFARRHKTLVASVAAIVVILIGATAVSLVMYVKADRALGIAQTERDRARDAESIAERRRKESEAVVDFLSDTLLSADPANTKGKQLTVREALDVAADKVATAFADQPTIEAAVRMALGKVYSDLGQFGLAEPQLRRAVALHRQSLDAMHPDLGDSLYALATMLWNRGDRAESETPLRESLRIAESHYGKKNLDVADRMMSLAAILAGKGRRRESQKLLGEAITIRSDILGEDDPSLAKYINELAVSKQDGGDLRGSVPLLRRALGLATKGEGPTSPYTALAHMNLGETLGMLGQAEEAEQHLRTSVDIFKKVYGRNHQLVSHALEKLSDFLIRQGRLDEAEPILREAVNIWLDFRGQEHEPTIRAQIALAALLVRQRRFAEAVAVYGPAVEAMKTMQAPQAELTKQRLALVHCLRESGSRAEATSRMSAILREVDQQALPNSIRKQLQEEQQALKSGDQ